MLKPRQTKLAELMATQPELSNEKYAELVGCHVSTIYEWKKDDEFLRYYHKLCEKRFRNFESLAVQKLMENANKGNQKAIEYLLNYLGYKPTEQSEVQMDANITIDYGE